ncbi:hypothetical protein A2U01_0072948, partial [Trifolium medium]|nr:hypothetical protein [Trifolium medium]
MLDGLKVRWWEAPESGIHEEVDAVSSSGV